MKFARLSLLVAALHGLTSSTHAAVAVTATGAGPLPFATIPATPADFSTTTVGTSATAYETPDALDPVVLNTVAANVNRALTNTATVNPVGTSAYARYNSTLQALQMRPTGNSYSLMMATLVNNAGDNISAFTLTFDYILQNGGLTPAAEGIPGLRTYFSVTGTAGSWQLLPTLSGLSATTVGASANISGITWPVGANAYVLWADDNSEPNADWGNTVDNFAISGVSVNPLPTTIAITSPTNGATTVPCANLTVTTTTTGNITNVAFLLNGVAFTNDTTLPYGGTVQVPCDLAPGSYTLTAVATDNTGANVTSDPVTFTVAANQPPTIAITNTYSGTVTGLTFLVGSPITIQATYADDDGITNIEWQVDGVLSLSNRINNAWTYLNALAGTHTLRGIATDRKGQQTISANWTITVTNPPSPAYTLLVTNGSDWKYYSAAAGAQPDELIPNAVYVQWYEFGYSETGWSTGLGELGDGDIANGYSERTLIDIGPDTAKYQAIYFRKKFNVANPATIPNLVVRLLRDDGAIVWINGVSVWTNNMATTNPDPIHPSAIANTNRALASDDGVAYQVLNLLNLPGNPLLSAGENIIAVQVHNQNPTSSDLSFDLMLWGESDLSPRVTLSAPTNGQAIAECSTLALAATASAYVTNVSFYANGTLLGSDGTAPYTGSLTNAGLTPVQVVAIAMDSFGMMATSAPVTLNISPNGLPSIAITNTFSVSTGTVFLVGSSITNRYGVTDDQGVTAVEVYLNGTRRYRDTAGFGQFVLNDAPAGNHTLSLVAFDNCGGSNSTSISLTITNPPYELLLTNQSLWKYNDSGVTQDVSWVTLAFDDTGWSNGFAELGFGAIAEDNPPVTEIRRNAGIIATNSLVFYFRKVINVDSPASYTNLILNVLRDDGAQIYINGTPVFTTSGNGLYPPTVAAGDDGTRHFSTNVSPAVLVAGPNIIAAEVRQNSVTSSDVAFDLMLWAEVGGGPAVQITSNGTSYTVSWSDASGQYLLQSTSTVGNPASWTDVPGNPPSPYTQPLGAGPQFFRLRKP
ncbi:MAG: hypothetical protein RJA22_2163 [Verrucomicrobiota bacterium]